MLMSRASKEQNIVFNKQCVVFRAQYSWDERPWETSRRNRGGSDIPVPLFKPMTELSELQTIVAILVFDATRAGLNITTQIEIYLESCRNHGDSKCSPPSQERIFVSLSFTCFNSKLICRQSLFYPRSSPWSAFDCHSHGRFH